ncbi:MAG: secretin N-terminal domain-containing protein [Trichloromonadaceae bacterium]
MLQRWLFVLLLGGLLWPGAQSPAYAEVKVIELRHRPASEMAATLEPLLGRESSVSAYGGKLILKGSAKELAELEQLVRKLDIQRSTLRLSVRQNAGNLSSGQQDALGGRIQTGPGAETELAARFERNLGTGAQTSEQFLLVLDGEEGYIAVGREVPYTSELAVLAGRHLAVAQRTEFRQVSTGFRVRPQLLAEAVQLELTPHMASLDRQQQGGELTFSTLTSKVVIPLGQWFNLAGHLESRDELSRAILARNLGSGQAHSQVHIKVDRVSDR